MAQMMTTQIKMMNIYRQHMTNMVGHDVSEIEAAIQWSKYCAAKFRQLWNNLHN